ncbi:MAG: serine/threonine-protein kinase [Planctomycetota bacterium]
MWAVYRARHRRLDRLVALKVLRPPAGGPADEAAFAERFGREARVLAKLDHPHIVRIHDFGQSSTQPPLCYLVLEYVDGPNLRELLRAGTLAPRDVLELVPQLCAALQAAHDVGVVHRDIKPENIIVDVQGRVRVADFGLAKLRGDAYLSLGLTRTDQVVGTLHYMAPEQLQGSRGVDRGSRLASCCSRRCRAGCA